LIEKWENAHIKANESIYTYVYCTDEVDGFASYPKTSHARFRIHDYCNLKQKRFTLVFRIYANIPLTSPLGLIRDGCAVFMRI
jgi:hypothetical protein